MSSRQRGGVTLNTVPDVCKTPEKGIPLPYKNEAYSRDLVAGTFSVFADGGNMIANYGSNFCKSIYDEEGSMGGIFSGTHLAEADWITHSFDVFFEKKAACRLTDKMFHNHRNTVNLSGVQQPPLTPVAALDLFCPAICYCSGAMGVATGATSATDVDFWKDVLVKQGRFNPSAVKSRTKQECVAKQFSSGWPMYTPLLPNTLPEVTYTIPSGMDTTFNLVKSLSGRTTSGGDPAPASPPSAMNQAANTYGKGNTVRWDFVHVLDSSKIAEGENLDKFIEIKFEGDKLTENQDKAKKILDKQDPDKLLIIEEKDCECNEREKSQQEVEETGSQSQSDLIDDLFGNKGGKKPPGTSPGGMAPGPAPIPILP